MNFPNRAANNTGTASTRWRASSPTPWRRKTRRPSSAASVKKRTSPSATVTKRKNSPPPPDFPTFSELRRHPQKRFSHRRPHRIPKELIFAHAGDEHWYLLLRHQTKQLAVALEFDDDGNDELPPSDLALIAALSLIWGVLYIFNRRQLLPLLRLREDMAQIGHGKWKQLEVNRTDEIGLLANEFNNMQTRLQAMLNARERFLIDASHELRSPITPPKKSPPNSSKTPKSATA